jgi:hypothetical protein
MIGRVLIAAALLLSGCAASDREAAPPSVPLQLIDMTGEFAAFRGESEGMEDAARIEAFKQRFATKIPGFYSTERVRFPGYNGLILKALKEYPADQAGIEDVSRRFADLLAPAQRSFERSFGPMSGYPPMILVHSLGEFDGGMRSLPGGGRLMFGADMIARLYKNKAIQPFFHHELFHLYHSRTFDDCRAVWCNLWNEGLATYVSHRLNSSASDDELLLNSPVPLRPAVEGNRKEAVCTITPQLDSENGNLNNALFSSRRLNERLPPRFGYYLGYLIAAEAGKTRSLRQLAELDNQQVRPLVEASLRSLADCAS